MRSIIDPADMTPDQRLREIAAILADGILRLRVRMAMSGSRPADSNGPNNSSDSAPDSLELSPETVLTVHGG